MIKKIHRFLLKLELKHRVARSITITRLSEISQVINIIISIIHRKYYRTSVSAILRSHSFASVLPHSPNKVWVYAAPLRSAQIPYFVRDFAYTIPVYTKALERKVKEV